MDKQREKLIELLHEAEIWGNDDVYAEADILLANGVIVQPLKEGDTAYVLFSFMDGIEEYTICKSPYSREEATYHLPVEEGEGHICVFPVSWKDMGKTVFLSREDAEKALEERKEK